jgi:hypothetical protein
VDAAVKYRLRFEGRHRAACTLEYFKLIELEVEANATDEAWAKASKDYRIARKQGAFLQKEEA